MENKRRKDETKREKRKEEKPNPSEPFEIGSRLESFSQEGCPISYDASQRSALQASAEPLALYVEGEEYGSRFLDIKGRSSIPPPP